jgi:hypothetical protein
MPKGSKILVPTKRCLNSKARQAIITALKNRKMLFIFFRTGKRTIPVPNKCRIPNLIYCSLKKINVTKVIAIPNKITFIPLFTVLLLKPLLIPARNKKIKADILPSQYQNPL